MPCLKFKIQKVCSLKIISQISQPASSVFLSQKNQPAILSASQISPNE
jgi:sensor domain CHASE-containing protein